jgi:hypothetical protein
MKVVAKDDTWANLFRFLHLICKLKANSFEFYYQTVLNTCNLLHTITSVDNRPRYLYFGVVSPAGAAEIQKPQETRLRNSSEALPRFDSPPFPSLRSACCLVTR